MEGALSSEEEVVYRAVDLQAAEAAFSDIADAQMIDHNWADVSEQEQLAPLLSR